MLLKRRLGLRRGLGSPSRDRSLTPPLGTVPDISGALTLADRTPLTPGAHSGPDGCAGLAATAFVSAAHPSCGERPSEPQGAFPTRVSVPSVWTCTISLDALGTNRPGSCLDRPQPRCAARGRGAACCGPHGAHWGCPDVTALVSLTLTHMCSQIVCVRLDFCSQCCFHVDSNRELFL